MVLSTDEKKHLRRIGHHLNPVVTLASKGLTEGVRGEADRALADHELIKVRVAVADRDLKKSLIDQLCQQTSAELVQTIGHMALILRRAKKPNPKLSNLLR